MVFLWQSIRRSLLVFSIYFCLVIPVCAGDIPASIVFVEAVPKGESPPSYRIIYLSSNGKNRKLLASLEDPVDLIQCNGGMVTYLDLKGNIWSLALHDITPNLLARTTSLLQEEATGKVFLRRGEKRLYMISNSDPGNLKGSNSRFQVKMIYFDGRERVIASESGRAYAIYYISPNTLEVASSNGLLQIDTLSMKMSYIIPFALGDLRHLVLVRGSYSVFSRNNGQLIEIKKGISGGTEFSYKLDAGFGLVQDFDDRKNGLLLVVINPSSGGDRLVEVFRSDVEREIHHGTAIGSACYMRTD